MIRVPRIIRTRFLATNIRHQFVKRLDSINIQSAAFACCWQIFVSQKISDPGASIFRWFLVRRTTQGISRTRVEQNWFCRADFTDNCSSFLDNINIWSSERTLFSKKSAPSKLLAPHGELIFDGFWWDFAKQGINLASKSTPKDAEINRHEAIKFGSHTAKC